MYCGKDAGENLFRMLCDHSRDHARQNVSGTPRSHARIARRIDPGLALRLNYQRAMALEHHDYLMFARKLPRHSEAIFLDVGDGATGQTRHLTRMRGDDKRPALAVEFVPTSFKRIQAVGIQNDGSFE